MQLLTLVPSSQRYKKNGELIFCDRVYGASIPKIITRKWNGTLKLTKTESKRD